MKCSRIKLRDRSEVRNKIQSNLGCEVCTDMTNKRSYQVNSLPSWERKSNSETQLKTIRLSISEIVLPPSFSQNSSGSQRWLNRRPRLRSSKSQSIHYRPKTFPVENQEKSNQEKEIIGILKTEKISFESSIDYDIDENVMKLIEEANEYDRKSIEELEEICRKKKKKRKKGIHDIRSEIANLDNMGITKQITLSRPVTPNTEQIIRVNVVSTFSVEENLDSDLSVVGSSSSELSGIQPKVTITKKTDDTIQCPDLTVKCQRLKLTSRKIQDQTN